LETYRNFFSSQLHSLSRPARLFLLALFLDGLLFSGWNLFFNLYILAAGYSRSFLGLVNAAPSLSALLLGVPMGMLSDRIGTKRSLVLGFLLSNFAIIGIVLSRSEVVILVLALLWGGVGQLFTLSQAPFMMRNSDDRNRDVLFSFSNAMFPLASTFGNLLAGYLPGAFTSWLHLSGSASAYRWVLLFSVVVSFVVLVPIGLIHEKMPARPAADPEARPPRSSIWNVLFRPLTLRLSLPNLVIGLGAAMLIPYFNVFFSEHYHFSDAMLGLLFGVGSLTTGLACLLVPRLAGNLGGKIRTIVIGQGTSLLFLMAIGFSPWASLAVAGYLVRGALMNMVSPLFDAYALERSHVTEHGAVNSIRNLAWNVGWSVGPYLSGVVQQHWGFSPLFISTTLLYALGISLTWIFFSPGPRRGRPSAVEGI
jgi:MFS family permease